MLDAEIDRRKVNQRVNFQKCSYKIGPKRDFERLSGQEFPRKKLSEYLNFKNFCQYHNKTGLFLIFDRKFYIQSSKSNLPCVTFVLKTITWNLTLP
jgi:hypothetical protein